MLKVAAQTVAKNQEVIGRLLERTLGKAEERLKRDRMKDEIKDFVKEALEESNSGGGVLKLDEVRETLVRILEHQLVIEEKLSALPQAELEEFNQVLHVAPRWEAFDAERARGQEHFQQEQHRFSEEKLHPQEANPHVNTLIKKLENFGVSVDSELHHLAATNAKVHANLEKMCHYVEDQTKKNLERKVHTDVMECVEFVGALGKHLNNHTLCTVSNIAGAAEKIRVASNALRGVKKLASLDGVASMLSIGTAVISILGCVAKQGPNPNVLLLEAINGVSEQVHGLRFEMHERFNYLDELLGLTYKRMVFEFSELWRASQNIQDLIETMRRELLYSQKNIHATLKTLMSHVDELSDSQDTRERKKILQEIQLQLDRILDPQEISTSKWSDLFVDLRSKITTQNPQDDDLVGKASGIANVVKSHEADRNNEFSADFKIAVLYKHFKKMKQVPLSEECFVTNPIVWSWQTMGLMALAQRRYRLDKPEPAISFTELEQLKEILATGQRLQATLQSFKNRELLTVLCDKYVQAGLSLQSGLASALKEQEETITNALNEQWAARIDSFGDSFANNFRKQGDKIRINPKLLPNWFIHYSEAHNNFGKRGWRTSSPYRTAQAEHGYAREYMEKYREQQTQNILSRIEKLILEARAPLDSVNKIKELSQTKYQLFLDSKDINESIFQGMLWPRLEEQPCLPLPIHYKGRILQLIQEAFWLDLVQLKFYYKIMDQRFIIEIVAKTPQQEILLHSFSVSYTPGIYGEVGQRFMLLSELNGKDPDPAQEHVLYLEINNGGEIHYKICTHGRVYEDTISRADLPDVSDDVFAQCKNKNLKSFEAIKTGLLKITLSRGHTSENEAIWKFWVGGLYPANESASAYVKYPSDHTIEATIWKNFICNPISTENKGCREKITEQDIRVEFDIAADSIALQEIAADIQRYKVEKITEVGEALSDQLAHDDTSSLAQLLIDYAHSFYMLKDALDLGFRDHPALRYGPLQFFNHSLTQITNRQGQSIALVRHRIDLLSLLKSAQGRTVSFCQDIENTLIFFNNEVRQAMTQLAQSSDSEQVLLQKVLNDFSELIELYTPRAVANNSVVSSLLAEERLTEENRAKAEEIKKREALIRSIGKVVLAHVDPEKHEELFHLVLEDYRNRGFAIEDGDAQCLLMGSPADVTSEQTVASAHSVNKKIKPRTVTVSQYAEGHHFTVQKIRADGNCFFRAVAYLLNEQNDIELSHRAVRQEALGYLRAHEELHVGFGKDMDEGTLDVYLTRMARDGTWARDAVLDAVALHYQIRIDIVDFRQGGHVIIHLNEHAEDRPLLTLARTGEDYKCQHYDALIADPPVVVQQKARKEAAGIPLGLFGSVPERDKQKRSSVNLSINPDQEYFAP